VIGNSQYHHVPRLANPSNDAQLIAETLAGAGFTLVGGQAQLDLDKIAFDRTVQEFGTVIQGAGVALFYYAGHGVQVRGANYLVPVGANPTKEADVDFQLVQTDLVLRQMELAGTRLNVLILDACRNNPFAGRGLRAAGGGLAQMQAPEGTLISYATQPGNVAQDGTDGHSPYTKALANAVRRPGLDLFAVFNETGLAVKKRTGGAQQPWVSSSPIEGTFYFAGAPPQTSTVPTQPPREAKPPESSPPTQSSMPQPPVQPAQDGAGVIESPFHLELGTPSKATLEKNEVSYFLASLPAGKFKVVLDTRQFDGKNTTLHSTLSITDADGAIVKDEVISFDEIDVAWRGTYNFSLKRPMKAGFKLTNFRNKADFWLVVLQMPSLEATENANVDAGESHQDDLRVSDGKEDNPQMRLLTLKAPRLLGQAQKRMLELPDTDDTASQHDGLKEADLKEADLKEYNPQMARLVPFPFFGKTMPKLLRVDQAQKGTLSQGESAYYITLLPQGQHKIVLGFDNTKRRNTRIQGYLAFLHADGGGQKSVIDFDEVDVSARKSAEVTCKKASIVVLRIKDNYDTVNYSVVVRPAE
jgi:hypothetical protein